MKKIFFRFIPILCVTSLLMVGCNQASPNGTDKAVKPTADASKKMIKNILEGKIIGKSNKAKTISIMVGKDDKAKTIMIKYSKNTKGTEYAKKGQAAIIEYKVIGKNKIATIVKQKLAKLPAGVTEIQPAELVQMMKDNENLVLVDSRPEKRFHAGTIPGSISISVPAMKKNGAKLLPPRKDIQLVFYCGGVT